MRAGAHFRVSYVAVGAHCAPAGAHLRIRWCAPLEQRFLGAQSTLAAGCKQGTYLDLTLTAHPVGVKTKRGNIMLLYYFALGKDKGFDRCTYLFCERCA